MKNNGGVRQGRRANHNGDGMSSTSPYHKSLAEELGHRDDGLLDGMDNAQDIDQIKDALHDRRDQLPTDPDGKEVDPMLLPTPPLIEQLCLQKECEVLLCDFSVIGVIKHLRHQFGGLEWIGVPVTFGAGTADAAADSTTVSITASPKRV